MAFRTRIHRTAMVGALSLAVAAGGLTLSAAPASASSGWWSSKGGGAKGFYNHIDQRVTACDVKSDGYRARVQIFSMDDRLLHSVTDSYNDGRCTWKAPALWSKRKIRVCVVKGNGRPVKCGAKHEFAV
ncbi:hypothetical protein [Streptomyces venezuelae]|uniref:hypothetical protein n=1 Tax=Streptomyces venezuelae TaxID=54571 RepID=UPI003445EBE9